MAHASAEAASSGGAHDAPADPYAFCSDCLTPAGGESRCRVCASPRVVRHDELARLAIAHVDCDAFYAAVEKRDNPALRDKPVIVGGARRGVVAACCYIARTYGVHSAMPMFKALKACPGAVVIKPDMEKYARVGREVREAMRALTPLVEPISIDEAFLDLSGTERLHHREPARSLAAFALQIERDIGITVSVGLSHNKFLAKIASDLDKPRGFSVLGRAEATTFLRGKPTGFIWGVGKSMQERLARDGIRSIAQLQDMDLKTLAARYGAHGERLHYLARGEDRRPVSPEHETKSISSETTFNDDIADLHELERVLWELCEKVARRLKAAELSGRTVTLKLKTASFRTLTRSRTLGEPTRLAERIFRTAKPLLARAADGTRFRLIGVGVSELSGIEEADRGDLVDTDLRRQALAEQAIDKVRDKFGRAALRKGRSLKNN